MPEKAAVINGVHVVLLGTTGNAGDANGVASITIPVEVDTLVEIFALLAEDVAAAVGLKGVVCTARPFSQLADGGYQVQFVFEGFNQTVTYEQAKNSVTVKFTPEERQDPIETHPKFTGTNGIGKTYKYNSETGKFAQNVDGSGGGSTALQAADKTVLGNNPMYGVDSWINFAGTFTRSYAVTEPPADLWDKVGMLIDAPPDADRIRLKKFKNRKWLKCAPSIESGERGSGSAIRIEERYKLTGILRGRPNSADILYAQAQLQ